MGEAEVRQSRARIVSNINSARRDIERRLHDGPQQHLVAMAVNLRLAEAAIDADPDAAKEMLEQLRDEVQATVQHLRDLAQTIYPPLLADRGLREALAAASARAGVHVGLTVDEAADRRYSEDSEAAVYFSCLDAIGAANGPLDIRITADPGRLCFDISGALPDGPGLVGIADWTDTIGGTLVVETLADGLHVHGEVPAGDR